MSRVQRKQHALARFPRGVRRRGVWRAGGRVRPRPCEAPRTPALWAWRAPCDSARRAAAAPRATCAGPDVTGGCCFPGLGTLLRWRPGEHVLEPLELITVMF